MNRIFNHAVCGILSPRFALLLLLITWFAVDARATQQSAEDRERASGVEVMLSSERVRFRAGEGIAALKLQVFNQAGELVYDSGEVTRAELLWGFKDSDDKLLRGGLYAYTFAVKRAEGEVAVSRRGHLIVEQTGGRVWLTTQGGLGVEGQDSGEMISGTIEGSVAGVRASGLQIAAPGPVTEAPGNKIQLQSKDNANGGKGGGATPSPLVVDGTGTVGRIPKWTTTTDIGNSVIAESNNGRIGIGTTAPTSKLEVRVSGGTAITGSGSTGVYGVAPNSGNGVMGDANQGMGVVGSSTGSYGVMGQSAVNVGVSGLGPTHGVWGATLGINGIGVRGDHSASTGPGPGVLGETNSTDVDAVGVLGRITPTSAGSGSAGVVGLNNSTGGFSSGVFGRHAGSGWGVYGEAMGGRGVFGLSNSGPGVYGYSGVDAGISGAGNIGVYGEASPTSFAGIYGFTQYTTGSWKPYAGIFAGRVAVYGTLTKSGGSFKIDHPLDPENKYLYHSFVESPDMKNIYDGVVTTDEKGEATVTLPDWFEALNRDFRYQLTVIGTLAQAIVASEVKDNHFAIKTSAPGVKVSWQVTGIRRDAWANKNRIPIEEAKPESERGSYLHPEVFGKAEEAGVTWKLHPELMKRQKEEREKLKPRQ